MWVMLLAFMAVGLGSDAQQPATEAEVVFHVAWYGVGKAALEGLDGVKNVENGIRKKSYGLRKPTPWSMIRNASA